MNTLTIVGYEQNVNCQHCNKFLKHGIRLDDGRVVGATCFDNKLTEQKEYFGKKYKIGANGIIRLAKIAEYVHPSKWSQQYGISTDNLTYVGKKN